MASDFKLSDEFVDSYRTKEIPWGYTDGGGNSLGEITYLRTYSRTMENGEKETWVDTCRRVIEGMFTLQKRHCRNNHIEWKNDKAQRTAKDAFDRLFHLKWAPAGRGLWAMGAPIVMEDLNSAPLQSCAFVSTDESVVEAFGFLFDASMLGVGVGFDADGAGRFNVTEPQGEYEWTIPDSREGWVESLRLLMKAFMESDGKGSMPIFDYSEIRPAGSPIKRFGGVASGSGPLIKMHDKIENILRNRIGSAITMRDIVDIGNIIGTCVVAGNVRRSAEIFFIDADAPLSDVDEFIDLKNYEKNPERADHGYISNNSVRVKSGADLTKLLPGIQLNGEPGVVYMDVVRERGRLKDEPDFKDMRVRGLNPCSFGGETLVHTTEGPKTIEELEGKPFWAMVDGEAYYSPVGSYITGQKNLYRLHTEEGFETVLTDNHEVLTTDGEWVEAGDLTPGDKIVLHNHTKAPTWKGTGGTWHEGYILGSVVGDGYVNSSGAGRLGVWNNGDVASAQSMMVQMEESLTEIYSMDEYANIRKDAKPSFTYRPDPYDMHYASVSKKILEKYGVIRGIKTTTETIEKTSSDFHRGYLRGILDADGHLEGVSDTSSAGISVRLGQSDLNSLKAVQRMLLRLGIMSKIRPAKGAGESELPDGKGGRKNYPTKASWRLIISANSVQIFSDLVGFTHATKAAKLAEAIGRMSRGFYKTKYAATFESLDFERFDDVWDLSVSTKRAFDANGLYVHNSEQPLESYETCVLGEAFIQNHDTVEDFIKTLKVAYLYGKTVTLLPTKWEKTNTIMQRNRRIGLSCSGVADYSDAHGLPKLRQILDKGFNYVVDIDEKYSEWLCIRPSIRHTTVKPSGSISILAGSSPGVHWTPGGRHFIRRITFAKTDPLFKSLKEAGYDHADLPDGTSAVILFPVESRSKRSSYDVPAWEKIHLAAELQHWWSDNAVSCTVDFSSEEANDIPKLLSMYDGKLKGISFLPQIDGGAYANMPYEKISEDTFNEMASKVTKANFNVAYSTEGLEAKGEEFCTDDTCEIEQELNEMEGLTVEV